MPVRPVLKLPPDRQQRILTERGPHHLQRHRHTLRKPARLLAAG